MTQAILHNPVEILPGRLIRDEAGAVTGREPAEPCPPLLDAEQAARLMLLDDLKDPGDVLYQYRKKGLLRGCQTGRNIRYLRSELMHCLELLMEKKPR